MDGQLFYLTTAGDLCIADTGARTVTLHPRDTLRLLDFLRENEADLRVHAERRES